MTKPGTPVRIDNPNKNNTEHPAISGEYWHDTVYRPRGPVAEIDYDLEPYRTVPQGHAGASMSKPQDDLDSALTAQLRTQDRTQLIRDED